MKKFSKILSVALLVALVLSLGVANAFAAPANVDLSISAVDGHTYTAYQLFVGDLATEGANKVLSNVKWGADVASSIKYYEKENAEATTFDVEKTIAPQAGGVVPQEVLDYVASLASNEKTTADTLASWVDYTNDQKGFEISSTATSVLTGYYVVMDAYTDPSAPTKTTLSTVMCQVVGPTTISPKAGETSHKKEVADVNDSTEAALNLENLKNIDASKWNESADHDFGDAVPFKLTTTIGSDFAKYTSYYLAVHDTMDAGLTFNESTVVVYVGDSEEPAVKGTDYTLTTSTANGKTTFDIVFNPLTTAMGAAAGKNVVVYYTATLNKDTAVIGEPGNWNESYAEFSNNPNDTQGGHGKTPVDTAVVFTFETDVYKVDGSNNDEPLKGAEFTLTKKIKDSDTPEVIAVIKYDKDGNVTTKSANGTASSDGDATKFSFKGLDDGIYTLTETVTPYGYNTIDPVTFLIEATHKATPKTGDIESLEVKNADGSTFTGKITFTKKNSTPDAGILETTIQNNHGTVLPSTGGIGTTIFYVVGGVLVLAAIILLVTKKRMSE